MPDQDLATVVAGMQQRLITAEGNIDMLMERVGALEDKAKPPSPIGNDPMGGAGVPIN